MKVKTAILTILRFIETNIKAFKDKKPDYSPYVKPYLDQSGDEDVKSNANPAISITFRNEKSGCGSRSRYINYK